MGGGINLTQDLEVKLNRQNIVRIQSKKKKKRQKEKGSMVIACRPLLLGGNPKSTYLGL